MPSLIEIVRPYPMGGERSVLEAFVQTLADTMGAPVGRLHQTMPWQTLLKGHSE
jgi:hypothetical protein